MCPSRGAPKGCANMSPVADSQAGPDPDAAPQLPLTLEEPGAPAALDVRVRRAIGGALGRRAHRVVR